MFEDRLQRTHQELRETYQGVRVARRHVRMPNWAQSEQYLPDSYSFAETPERLATTSITIVLVSRGQVQAAELGFHYDGPGLPTLRMSHVGAVHLPSWRRSVASGR